MTLWGAAAAGFAALSTLQIAFGDEPMAGLGFLFGLPAMGMGVTLVAVGHWLSRDATWARWAAVAIGSLVSAGSLFLAYQALIDGELSGSAISLQLLSAAIGLCVVAAAAWPRGDPAIG
jgi:hypothetical protein